LRTIRRGGPYLRVADPAWKDPLDGQHAALRGGRWNPPASFPVVYLCREVAVARANVDRLLADQPYGPEDLRPEAGPVLVRTRVPEDRYLNVITDAGCRAVGLPASYPRDTRGRVVPHPRCQPIGEQAHERGLPGVAARSAVSTGEELAYFGRRRLRRGAVLAFDRWFWEQPAG
jgi:RES domain